MAISSPGRFFLGKEPWGRGWYKWISVPKRMSQSVQKNISIFKRKRISFVDERKWFEKDTCVRKYFWIGKNNFWILKIRIRVDGTPITDCFACQVWLCFILFLVSTLITSAKYFFRRLWWWFIWRSWVELIMRYVLIACAQRFTCGCSGKIFGGQAANGPRKSDFSLLDGGSAFKIIFLKFA